MIKQKTYSPIYFVFLEIKEENTFQVREISRLPFVFAMSVSFMLTMTGCVVSSERGHLFIKKLKKQFLQFNSCIFFQHVSHIYHNYHNSINKTCLFLMLYSVLNQ